MMNMKCLDSKIKKNHIRMVEFNKIPLPHGMVHLVREKNLTNNQHQIQKKDLHHKLLNHIQIV